MTDAKHVERQRCEACGFIVILELADPRQQVIFGSKACPRCGGELWASTSEILGADIGIVTDRRLRERKATADVGATGEQFDADAVDIARIAAKFWGDDATRLLERAAAVASELASGGRRKRAPNPARPWRRRPAPKR